MTNVAKWMGSVDPADLTGTATFTAGGEELVMRLESFEQFRAVKRMLDLSHDQGKRAAARDLDRVVRDRIAQIEAGLGVT